MNPRLAVLNAESISGAWLLEAATPLLPAAELAALLRKRDERDQAMSIAARLVALELARELANSEQVELWRSPAGRLETGTEVDVSVSHSYPWVVVAGVTGGKVGVDVDSIDSLRDVEASVYLSVPCPERYRDKAALWVLKEAQSKCDGTGFLVDPITIKAEPENQNGHRFVERCWIEGPAPGFLMGLALRDHPRAGPAIPIPTVETWEIGTGWPVSAERVAEGSSAALGHT